MPIACRYSLRLAISLSGMGTSRSSQFLGVNCHSGSASSKDVPKIAPSPIHDFVHRVSRFADHYSVLCFSNCVNGMDQVSCTTKIKFIFVFVQQFNLLEVLSNLDCHHSMRRFMACFAHRVLAIRLIRHTSPLESEMVPKRRRRYLPICALA